MFLRKDWFFADVSRSDLSVLIYVLFLRIGTIWGEEKQMLTEIRLINYKAFLCTRITLEPITIFIGPNGSGKSTIASALYALSTTIRLGLIAAFPEGFFSFWNLRHFDAKKCGYKYPPIGIGVSGDLDGFSFDYDIFFSRDVNSSSGFFISYEGLRIRKGKELLHYTLGSHPDIDFDLPTKGEEK